MIIYIRRQVKKLKLFLIVILLIFAILFVGTSLAQSTSSISVQVSPTSTSTLIIATPHPNSNSSLLADPGPIFDYPNNGETIPHELPYLFRVFPFDDQVEYLWSFIKDGELVWENFRDEGHLSSNEYKIYPCSEAHSHFPPGEIEVWVRGLRNHTWTDATIITINLEPSGMGSPCDISAVKHTPVVQINYFPPDPNNPEYLDYSETGWVNIKISDMEMATQEMADAGVAFVTNATRYHGYREPYTRPYLGFEIVSQYTYYEPMPRGYPLSGVMRRPHYGDIMRDIDICSHVDDNGVKEVWIYGYHWTVIIPDESKMSSRYGDISNAWPKDENIPEKYRLPRCDNSYVLYNFTYQPGGAGAIGNNIHNRMHQIENAIPYAGYSLFWEDFSELVFNTTSHDYISSCGNAHYTPNWLTPDDDYDYDLYNYRDNNCETWHPDDNLTTYVYTNCGQWNCSDTGFYYWYMQNMPGYKNDIFFVNGCHMRNWWEAMYDFNAFIDIGQTLYSCGDIIAILRPSIKNNNPEIAWPAVAGATRYDIFFAKDDPYFSPGKPYFSDVISPWQDPAPKRVGNPDSNFFYLVQVHDENDQWINSQYVGYFDFALTTSN